MAKARKLPSGNWRCLVRKTIDGKQISKSFTAPTKKEAEFLAAEWVANETDKLDNLTLKTACERYIEAKESVLSPATVREYKNCVNRSMSIIMNVKIDALTREQVQKAINIEAASHSPKTVRNIHGFLSAVLKMFRPGFVLNTQLPQKLKTKMHIPTDADVKTVLDAAKGTYVEIAILLAAFGPMRRGEICALTDKDISGNMVTVNKAFVLSDKREWVLKTPKTYSSNRTIIYPEFVIEKIKDIKGNLIPCTPDSLSRAFTRVLKSTNLEYFRFHDLRHYCVSICKAMNIPDEYIMARGGWATNYTMNNVYAHTLPDVQDAITNRILDHFSSVNEHESEHA